MRLSFQYAVQHTLGYSSTSKHGNAAGHFELESSLHKSVGLQRAISYRRWDYTSHSHTSGLSLLLWPSWAGGQLFPLATASEATVRLLGEVAGALPEPACAAGASQSEVRSMRLSSTRCAAHSPPVCAAQSAGALHPMLSDADSRRLPALGKMLSACLSGRRNSNLKSITETCASTARALAASLPHKLCKFTLQTEAIMWFSCKHAGAVEVLPSASSLLVSISGRSAENLCFPVFLPCRCGARRDISATTRESARSQRSTEVALFLQPCTSTLSASNGVL